MSNKTVSTKYYLVYIIYYVVLTIFCFVFI